jgi:tyrosine-protein phosphatase YwqE
MGEIDTHCHILPNLDDGPPDDEGALAIARVLVEIGVQKVVATPHVISDIYPLKTAQIIASVEKLRILIREAGLALEVIAGAEYYVEGQLLDRIDRNDVLAWGKERNVLFESPVENEPILFKETIFRLKSAGFTPVLAHTERYRFLQNKPEEIDELRRLGTRFQVNHPSFHLPKISRRGEMARWLYIKGLVDFFGTDMHRATGDTRPALPKTKLGQKSVRRPKSK